MRRLLTWLYKKLIRDYVLVDMFLTRTSQTNTLYVVHLYGSRVVTTEEKQEQQVRWN